MSRWLGLFLLWRTKQKNKTRRSTSYLGSPWQLRVSTCSRLTATWRSLQRSHLVGAEVLSSRRLSDHTQRVRLWEIYQTPAVNVYDYTPKTKLMWLIRRRTIDACYGCCCPTRLCATVRSLSLPTRSTNAPKGHVTNPRGTGIALIPIAAAGIGYTAAPSCFSASSTTRSSARPYSLNPLTSPHNPPVSPAASGCRCHEDAIQARYRFENTPGSIHNCWTQKTLNSF